MKIQNLLFVLLFLTVSTITEAQMKIGYVNIELVLFYMPESRTMNQELQTFQQKLGEKLQVKRKYAQTKLEEYQQLIQKDPQTDPATIKKLEQELIKLDEEIKNEGNAAEQKILEKRQELMQPILEKLDNNLKTLATEEAYDYLLNSVDGNGVSIVLHGPEEHDLTRKLMKKLGIKIPSND